MQKKSAVHGKNTRVFETQNTKIDRRFGPFLVSRQLLLFCLLYMPPSRRFTADAGAVTDFFSCDNLAHIQLAIDPKRRR